MLLKSAVNSQKSMQYYAEQLLTNILFSVNVREPHGGRKLSAVAASASLWRSKSTLLVLNIIYFRINGPFLDIRKMYFVFLLKCNILPALHKDNPITVLLSDI